MRISPEIQVDKKSLRCYVQGVNFGKRTLVAQSHDIHIIILEDPGGKAGEAYVKASFMAFPYTERRETEGSFFYKVRSALAPLSWGKSFKGNPFT